MASNAAHCLATGCSTRIRLPRCRSGCLGDDMFSGWGIRTLGANERRYNPMSYHNGSVWPHDNAIAALGLARYGNRVGALSILEGLFDAAVQMKTPSLPELFCGFQRKPRLGPIPYPVACYPQAWSAASVFMILQALLGLEVNGFRAARSHRLAHDSDLARMAADRRSESGRRFHILVSCDEPRRHHGNRDSGKKGSVIVEIRK